MNKIGEDVTHEFQRGAEFALKAAKINKCFACLLKERSPSCGVKSIYDGSFENKLIAGSGVTSRMLITNGFNVLSEEEIDKLL